MKIIYLMEWNFCQLDGVIKKVLNQIASWKTFGHDVRLYVLSNCKDIIEIEDVRVYYKSLWNRVKFKKLYDDIKQETPDLIYFRYSAYKPYLNKIFSEHKVVIELNSNVIEEKKLHKNNSLKDFFVFYYVLFTNKYMEKKASGIIAVTYELAKSVHLDNNIIVIPNSINLNKINRQKKVNMNNQIPQLIFMGTPNQAWHGVDKIIELAQKTEGILHFNIIGIDKPDSIHLTNITFYGYINKEKYTDILCSSDIGIGTLALHRKNMEEACPLKVREYLAYGLPCILGYTDTAFIRDNKSWLLKLENTDTNVKNNIDKIVSFCYDQKDVIVNSDSIAESIGSTFLEKERLNFMIKIVYA